MLTQEEKDALEWLTSPQHPRDPLGDGRPVPTVYLPEMDEYLCEFVVYGDWDHYEGCFWTNIDGEWTCVEFIGRHGEWWRRTKPKPSNWVVRAVTSMLKELEPGRLSAFVRQFNHGT